MKSFLEYLTELSIQAAASFAATYHKGQTRKLSGDPYVVHPEAVFNSIKKLGIKDRNILTAAYLHDTVEDTPATYNKIKNEFNKDVADLVKELTSSDKEIKTMGKPAYLAKKMIQMSDNALVIKLADRWHNVQDVFQMSEKKAKKMIMQTNFILGELKAKRNLNKNHKKIIREIEKTLERSGVTVYSLK